MNSPILIVNSIKNDKVKTLALRLDRISQTGNRKVAIKWILGELRKLDIELNGFY